MPTDAFFEMWRLIREHFGTELCDKGDTLYWRWMAPQLERDLGLR